MRTKYECEKCLYTHYSKLRVMEHEKKCLKIKGKYFNEKSKKWSLLSIAFHFHSVVDDTARVTGSDIYSEDFGFSREGPG